MRNKILALSTAAMITISSVATADDMTLNTNTNPTTNAAPMADNLSPASTPSAIIPAAPNLDVKAFVLMDQKTGTVIAQKNQDQSLPPASLTKLMDLYVIFDALKQGTIKLDDKVLISSNAWKTGGSKMFVKAGDRVQVSDLIQGIIVQSGNDATVAMAEYIAGSEQSFVDVMNQQAARLGMKDTHFEDVTGLPSDTHKTTALDLAILSRALIANFPDQYHYFGEKWFTYAGIKQPNRDRLLWRFEGADGLKTGHTEEAGFCLVSSALRNDQRLISVVLGAPSDSARSNDAIQLLTYGFRFYRTEKLYDAMTPVTKLRVWKGENKETSFGLAQALYATVPVGSSNNLKTAIEPKQDITAPVKKGAEYGSVTITLGDKIVASAPLIALDNNNEGGFFGGLMDDISKTSSHLFGKKDKTEEKADS